MPDNKTPTHDSSTDFEVRRLHTMASSHRELKDYVDYITQHLEENERLFARLFALEARLLKANDPEDVCLALLRGLRADFELDMVRLWFDRASFISQYSFHGLSPEDLVWVEKNEISEVGLSHQAVWLVQLGKGERFVWLEKQDAKLKSMALILLGPIERPYGVIGLGSLNDTRFDPEQGTDFLQHLAQVCSLMLENTVSRERLSRLMVKDRNSGAHKQRFFQPYSHQPLSQWFGRNIPVACFCIAVDERGGSCGNDTRQAIAQSITSLIRHQDLLICKGKEDFIVFLAGLRPMQDVDTAEAMMDACLTLHVSLSIGASLSSCDEDPLIVDLLARAEKAMQQAIKAGGARVICATVDDLLG
ncbi:MAG: DUF484 family protein [Mariprofundaceae bacterium]|nr:DUF484 family protein [Mariprofundaceae bacterium]